MQFEQLITPQYRDAGADGTIGLKGYMNYCQDAATWHMKGYDLGNDRLIEEFGMAWMYTKCRMKIFSRTGFHGPLLVETGMTSEEKVRVDRDFRITQAGKLLALSRLESCLYKVDENRLCKIRDIDYPINECDEPFEDLTPKRLPKDISGMDKIYDYRIRYSVLDKSMHMNNLHFTDLFMNVFGPEFYETHVIREYDINYISQGMYNMVLGVYMKREGDVINMAAADEDGRLIAACRMVACGKE